MPDGPILRVTRHPLDPRGRGEVLHCAALLPVDIYSPFHCAALLVRTQAPVYATNDARALGIAPARQIGSYGSAGVFPHRRRAVGLQRLSRRNMVRGAERA